MLVAPCSGPTWKTLPNCSTNPPLPSNSPNHVRMSLSFGFEPTTSPINAYTLSGDKAASLFVKSAKCHLKLDSKYDAANAYVDAAHCYKKTSTSGAISCLNKAVTIFTEIGRHIMAAKYSKEIGELYELDQDIEHARSYYERAAELFEIGDAATSVIQCKVKVAQFCAQLQQYQKAIKIYEDIARQSLDSNLLKYGVRGHLLNSGLCQLVQGDFVAITNSLERYQDLDLTFSRTREYKFLADLSASIDEGDVEKFTRVVKEFNSITPLESWKSTLLLRVKDAMKVKEMEDDDLT
ncbi:alpha-soluble NSF attachment protein 2-like isoform X1 [Glycine soja]|uniref:Alpha-soluble NSF attachment protein isoform B n=1 Tax=Glycine soja TaxID=3848 RepID=A0A445J779_GLYSO|nr:alpha-soluble NSF attachment protein 2-like isoform X1 [Glycine soja]RZB94254.1 Alpha-soluble NSF attachment protein isoform B [Glycine soja]